MATLIDYLSNNMDKSIAEKPLNEVDYAVLTMLSTIDFEGIVSEGPSKITIADAYKKFMEEKKTTGNEVVDSMLIKMANSKRFKNLKLSHFMQTENPETCEQFAAIAVDLNLNHKACFFRPTNGSIYAWKENFKVVHQETTCTQDRANEWFTKVARFHPLQRFTLCGHSKGGNNAMYAASKANILTQSKIKQVINFDGPGFNNRLNKGITNKFLLEKVKTYIPQGSVVGRLLDHNESKIVLKGGKNNELGQHDLLNWPVGEDSFLRAEKTNYKSDAMDRKIRQIFATMDEESGKLFVDGLFHILSNTGYDKLDDVIKNPKSLFHSYFKTDKKERVAVRKVALMAIRDKKFMKIIFGKDSAKVAGYGEHLVNGGKRHIEQAEKITSYGEEQAMAM